MVLQEIDAIRTEQAADVKQLKILAEQNQKTQSLIEEQGIHDTTNFELQDEVSQ